MEVRKLVLATICLLMSTSAFAEYTFNETVVFTVDNPVTGDDMPYIKIEGQLDYGTYVGRMQDYCGVASADDYYGYFSHSMYKTDECNAYNNFTVPNKYVGGQSIIMSNSGWQFVLAGVSSNGQSSLAKPVLNITSNGMVYASNDLYTNDDLFVADDLLVDDNIVAIGTITANKYYGDGSELTGISESSIDFDTTCSSGQYLSTSGNDLVCSTPTVSRSDTRFNIMDYGAVGDDSTDNAHAIQNAMDNASLVHGTVYIPTGTFRVNSQLLVPKNIKIVGDGDGSYVKLRWSPAEWQCKPDAHNVTFENFRTDFGASRDAYIIECYDEYHFNMKFKDMTFASPVQSGRALRLNGTWIDIDHCNFDGVNQGISIAKFDPHNVHFKPYITIQDSFFRAYGETAHSSGEAIEVNNHDQGIVNIDNVIINNYKEGIDANAQFVNINNVIINLTDDDSLNTCGMYLGSENDPSGYFDVTNFKIFGVGAYGRGIKVDNSEKTSLDNGFIQCVTKESGGYQSVGVWNFANTESNSYRDVMLEGCYYGFHNYAQGTLIDYPVFDDVTNEVSGTQTPRIRNYWNGTGWCDSTACI